MHDIWPQLKQWVSENRTFALATVVDATKPSPRGIGAVLAINENGDRFIGSVSAGCVENEVIERAKTCIQNNESQSISFGPSHGIPWEISLSCGGRITVRIDPFIYDSNLTPRLAKILDEHAFALWIARDAQQLLFTTAGDIIGDQTSWSANTIARARDHLARQSPTEQIDTDDGPVLFRSLEKPKRLFVFGAVHIATHLVGIARSLNYQVIIIDPRETYTQAERFTEQPDYLICAWPNEALARFSISPSDSAIMITHDPKIDDDALSVFLKSDSDYIGALGSRKSHEARMRRLVKKGFNEDTLKRIHGPIGIDIGSKTPAEIAVSIIAEIIREKNRIVTTT